MACDDCGKGIDLTAGVDGQDAPTITNIDVNPDNTITFTFSDSSQITTASAVNTTPTNLAYVYYSDTSNSATNKQFVIAADELDADGDGFDISMRGLLDILPGASDLVLTFNGDVHTIYDNAENIPAGGGFFLNGQIYRKDATTIQFDFNLRVVNFDFSDPNFDEGDLFDEISGIVTSTADFASPITFNVGQSGATIYRLAAHLFKND